MRRLIPLTILRTRDSRTVGDGIRRRGRNYWLSSKYESNVGICTMSHLRNVKAISSAISYVPVCIAYAAKHVAGALNRTVRLPRHYRVNYVCLPCQWSTIISSSVALYWISRCLVTRRVAASRFNGLYHLLSGIHPARLVRSPCTTHKTLHLWCSTHASAYSALARMIKAPAPGARVIVSKPFPSKFIYCALPPVST